MNVRALPRPAGRRDLILRVAVCALACCVSGCASWPRSWGARPCCIQTKPVVHREPVWWHLFDVTVVSQIENSFELARVGRRLFGAPVRAQNLHDGYVGNSAFFTDRDPVELSPERVRWGPTRPDDVAVAPFTVTKPKIEGKTPGFFVTDARGRRYLLKLDPVDAPELLSGAEVVTSKLLYALGYHVPSYEVGFIKPGELQMTSPTASNDGRGAAHPLTEEALRAIVEPRLREGVMRVGVTKILEGDILGPARFKRFRDCAEVRALQVAYAWLNNIDAKDHNSLLVWNGRETVGYLIDFGTSLGADAGAAGPKQPCAGWTNIIDMREASLKLLTLGFHRATCDSQRQPESPSVGLFSPHVDPDRWKPYAPNLAFQEMTESDARWIAHRMARLTHAQITAAVSAGQYRNPADAAYLVDMLEQRRHAIVSEYLDDPSQEDPTP